MLLRMTCGRMNMMSSGAGDVVAGIADHIADGRELIEPRNAAVG